jgi:hypothetical protein
LFGMEVQLPVLWASVSDLPSHFRAGTPGFPEISQKVDCGPSLLAASRFVSCIPCWNAKSLSDMGFFPFFRFPKHKQTHQAI